VTLLTKEIRCLRTVDLLRQFNRFASITLFKPSKCHAKRSSFYLVASNIQTEHPGVVTAIQNWKHTWAVATFGGDENYEEIVRRDNSQAERILDDFGSELVRLGRKIWDIQPGLLRKRRSLQDRPCARVLLSRNAGKDHLVDHIGHQSTLPIRLDFEFSR
jgi:hypothetical protein